MKEKACQAAGFFSQVIRLPAETREQDLLGQISLLNSDPKVNGILVQMPLPKGFSEGKVIDAVSPDKDVDGFHPYNVGRLASGNPTFVPCTPLGIIRLLEEHKFPVEGRHAVIIGRSNIVGKPVANLLLQKSRAGNATVTVCHSKTAVIGSITTMADILIAAIGSPMFVKADMVRKGAVVIDVGVNRVDDPSSPKGYRLVGDVDFDKVKDVASAITPVPGGVGPMTIAMLLENTLKAFKKANGLA
jgi:methylenetetrahydrofolate dehydrogenase (NADP+)/methenyltetrahydrofolate cyclohydrolase